MIEIELKLHNNKRIFKIEKVKQVFVENGFCVIVHQIEKNKLKFEPIALENIDYWIEVKKR